VGFGERVGCHVFAYDYVGYSTSQLEGDAPSEAGCVRAIQAAWDYLTQDLGLEPGDIVLYGRSIGSGPTCALASSLPCRAAVAGVVLQSPVYSGASVLLGCGSKRAWLSKPFDIFRNYELLPLVARPVAIMHGQQDEVVPWENGQRLLASCQRPFKPLWFDGSGHNDLPRASVERFVQGFLAELARPPKV
jgi:pimeloyl-ACP methyl ester carboxylesterase